MVLEGATGATVGVPEGSNIGAILLGELDGAVVGDKVVEIYEVQPETLDDWKANLLKVGGGLLQMMETKFGRLENA